VVNFSLPVATDNCSGPVTVTTDHASGSLFPVGTTTVTVTAKDAANNTSTCTFTITVNDTQPPVITCPANIIVNTAIGQCSAVVNYTPIATDNCSGPVTIVSTPASGSVFTAGTTTTVTSVATDAAGNTATCSFTVTVVDAQPPAIAAPLTATTVCLNQNTTIAVAATNAVSYQWQVNTGSGFTNINGATSASLALNNVSMAMNGNQYRVVVTGVCSSIVSGISALTVNPLPSVSISASPLSSLKPGDMTSITASTNPATGGILSWTLNGVPITNNASRLLSGVTVDGIGTYNATYTDANGCSATSPDFILGATASDNLFVYPNPNNGIFQVRYYTSSPGVSLILVVYNARGQKIYANQMLSTGNYTKIDVDLSKSLSGIYLVELRGANGKLIGVKRVVVGN
jgi:hypothetical protein